MGVAAGGGGGGGAGGAPAVVGLTLSLPSGSRAAPLKAAGQWLATSRKYETASGGAEREP